MSNTEGFQSGHEDDPSLEQKVVDLFEEVRRVLSKGSERFPAFGKNTQDGDLQEAVGWLAIEELVELISGNNFERLEGQGIGRLKASVDLWSDEETARKLHKLAYSAYVEAQNGVVNSMLNGRRITAVSREGSPRSAISDSDGHFETMGRAPRGVSGTFYRADTNVGNIILAVDNPTDEVKYWIVRLVDLQEPAQLVDISLQN